MAELWYTPLDRDAHLLLGPTVPDGRHAKLDYHTCCGDRSIHLHWLLGCG